MNQLLHYVKIGLKCCVIVLWVGSRTNAAFYLDSSPDSDHVNAATNFQGGVLWMEGYVQDNPTNFHTSAAFLNPWNVLFATHQTVSLGKPITYTLIGTGNNYSNSPGVTSQFFEVVAYAGYNPDGSTIDLAIGHLKTPLPYPTGPGVNTNGGPLSLSPLTFASVSENEPIWGNGFGVWGTPSGGLHLQDGNARAWTAPVELSGRGFSDAYYFSGLFFPGGGLGAMNGRGAGNDSGGPWYDSAGNLVGLSDAGNTSYTIIERLSLPEIQDWITANMYVPLTLAILAEGSGVRLVWQGKGGSNYVVQAASTLSGTNVFTDLSAPITLSGVGAVTTNYLDSSAMTNQAARFYRIRSN